ncbi:hypothetical protein MYX82_13480 [Acidobacteria bacterium AH-259-D05]|nr:hypothetical protein [Acidobacteria bacterium AH-259-D05]
MPSEQYFFKLGGLAAILGVLVLFTATLLHPLEAHPGDAPAAFTEYAADQYWVATHLGQLFGVVLISAGLISLSWRLREGRAGVWATLGALGAVASVSVAAALQAVDGIALKFMVDRWTSAPPDSKSLFFESAFGVRQIEIGLASMMSLLVGLTVVLFGVALLLSLEGPTWLGLLGMLGGFATMAAGVVQAHTGFSDAAMAVSMPSSLVLLLWAFCAGIYLLRRIVA